MNTIINYCGIPWIAHYTIYHEPAQNGGTTDPSWPAHDEVTLVSLTHGGTVIKAEHMDPSHVDRIHEEILEGCA